MKCINIGAFTVSLQILLKSGWWSDIHCNEWTGSWLGPSLSLWKLLILLGCQKKQHPSLSFSGWSNHQIMVTLAASIWQWKPSDLAGRIHRIKYWHSADAEQMCDIRRTSCADHLLCNHPHSNALTAGGPSPKQQINRSNQRKGSSATPILLVTPEVVKN